MSGFISACFTGETPVHTPLGLVRIDDIRVGDWVFSRDECFGIARVQRRQVTALFRFENRAVLDITICAANGQSETLRTTPEHPFAILSAGPEARAISGPHRHTDADVLTRAYIWRAAGELEIGLHTVDIAGRTGTIVAIEPAPGLTTVYNFAVDDLHTYFVGEAGVWVHNRYDAADEAVDVEQVSDSLYLSFDESGKVVNLLSPGLDFSGEPSDTDRAIALGLTLGDRTTRDSLLGAALVRGGVDTAVGTVKLAYDISLAGQARTAFRWLSDFDGEKQKLADTANGLRDLSVAGLMRYGGRTDAGLLALGDGMNWLGGAMFSDLYDASGMLAKDSSAWGVMKAGYEMETIGSVAFSAATIPIGLEVQGARAAGLASELTQGARSLFPGYMRFRSMGFSPAQAKYLAEPYPSSGMGSHFFPRKAWGFQLPKWLGDSPLNVLRPQGISRGDFYELHFKVDPRYYGSAFPRKIGGSWRGKALGIERYDLAGRIWYGSPAPLKLTVGGALGTPVATGILMYDWNSQRQAEVENADN
jgi:Pretoxin HINT domain